MINILQITEKPLYLMGSVASKCWNSQPSSKIGITCIESNHGRVMEYVDMTIEISEYSARMIRELYTHIIGTTRLQESTRYVDQKNFNYYVPQSIINNKTAFEIYTDCMLYISNAYKELEELEIPKEDVANVLPIGSHTKMVLKINLRALLHMAELRLCKRALKEYQEFMLELAKEITKKGDEEWIYLLEHYYKPKCDILGYCNEKHSCGRKREKHEK